MSEVLASRDGIALAELSDGDLEVLRGEDDAVFDVDPDDRPNRLQIDPHRLAVLDEESGKLLGRVSWHAVGYGRTAACEAWNVGFALLPSARGRGAGTAAMRLLVAHLFATTDVDRIEAGTEVLNVAARKSLERAGFRAEGRVRGAIIRDGERRDYVSYSMLRRDLPGADRVIVAARDGVALAEVAEGDLEALRSGGDRAYEVDPDDGPSRVLAEAHRLIILDEPTGELLGQVSWAAVGYGGTAGGDAWTVGIALAPVTRGRGVGPAALRLLVEHLFATTGVDRIEAGTEVTNIAARKALGRAGFRVEGITRGAIVRDGVRRDDVRFGLLRQDFAGDAGDRVILVERDGVALAEPLPGDRATVFDRCTSEFDLDADLRPPSAWPTQLTWLTIMAGGEPVGGLSVRTVSYGGTVANLAWALGIGLLPEARGQGVGSAAQRLAAEYLFDTTEFERVEATTDVDNVAEQRALAKAGFTREGVTRGAQLRGGIRRDVVHYGLLRSDLG